MAEKLETPLKKLRRARGVTQAIVAEAVGIDQSSYHRIESGEGGLAGNAEKIAKYFGSAINEQMILYPERYPDYEVGQR